MQGEYRFQLWYFTTQVTQIVPGLAKLQCDFPWPDGVTQTLDVDPASLT